MLFIMLYKVVVTSESVDEILKCDFPTTALPQYRPVVRFASLKTEFGNFAQFNRTCTTLRVRGLRTINENPFL